MNNELLFFGPEAQIFIDLVVIDLVYNGIPRQVYQRAEHFHSMSELVFFQHFRLKKQTVLDLLGRIEHALEYPHNLNNSISPINQLLICLRYYATGNHQLSLAYFGGVQRSSVHRIIKRVTRAICELKNEFIKFPENQEQIRKIELEFARRAHFPKVLGAVDGTHIRIISPGGEDAEIFRNRKGYFSINVQVLVDSQYKFQDIVARWPGSTHDMTIFNNSNARAVWEANVYPNNFLLGDSGYAIKPYLLTPLLAPQNEAERRYNNAHVRTRVVVENTIGIWKRRFPILAYGCRTKLPLTMGIIVACSILHNIARNANEADPPAEYEDAAWFANLIQRGNMNEVLMENNRNHNGFQTRNALINEYFANM